jgi:hypothetical protein
MASRLRKGSFGLSLALTIACTISILLISAVTVSAQTFNQVGAMSITRANAAGAQLLNGKVLVAGGFDSTGLARGTAELYNPATGAFSSTGSMVQARAEFAATLLTNGKVLVTGGVDNNGNTLNTAELYNPSSGTFTSTGNMTIARQDHQATLLANGQVLIAGGLNLSGELASAEIYNPTTGTFTETGDMNYPRAKNTATLLPSGGVLVAGGSGSDGTGPWLATAELYDPSTGTFALTGSMAQARGSHTATLLFDGRVLIAGGLIAAEALDEAEIYDPSTRAFTRTGDMTQPGGRADHTATLLANGQVLMAGGESTESSTGPSSLISAELFDPSSGTFSATGNMAADRKDFVASLLSDGAVFVTGTGYPLDQQPGLAERAELYTPATMPVAKIMSPVNNSVVQNKVIISTTVSSQVQWINLYVDGNYITSSQPYNFTWDSTTVANGSHTISIEAFNYNSSGKKTEVGSDSITVNVENGTSTPTPTVAATPTPTPMGPTPTPTPTPTPAPTSPVTITAPSNGSTVSGTVSIVTTKSAPAQWENIYIDGNYLASSPPETFSWDSTTVSNGSHAITAKGFNSSDQVVGTASVTVNVQNGSAGQAVTITSPTNGATVTGTITIDTTIGSNAQWENIYIDGNYLASSPPETFQWDTTSVPDGSHTISAEAFASGRVLQGTASITVNVGN